MVARNNGTRGIITILTAAILAAATPCFAGTWDDLAGGMKKDEKAASKTAVQNRAKGLTSMLATKNAAAAKRIGAMFKYQEKKVRNICAPDFSSGYAAAPGEKEGFQAMLNDYKNGKISFTDVAFARANLDASLKRYTAPDLPGGGAAQMEQLALHSTDKRAIAQNLSNQRASFVQGQYPGSSMSCFGGNGTMAWNQSEIATFRDEIAWKIEATEGRLKTTYVALDEGGFNITLEYGQFSATVALMMPGSGAITPNKIRAAVDEYNAALKAAYEAKGIDPTVSSWQAMKEGYDRGDSPEKLKQDMHDRYVAGGQAVPQMLAVSMAVSDAKFRQETAAHERYMKEMERRQTGGVEIQDAPFQIIALSLDSSREKSLSEKDAAVKQNDMIKHVETLYRQKLSDKGDIIAALSLIIQDPDLRQSIAK